MSLMGKIRLNSTVKKEVFISVFLAILSLFLPLSDVKIVIVVLAVFLGLLLRIRVKAVYYHLFVSLIIFSCLTIIGLPKFFISYAIVLFLLVYWIKKINKDSKDENFLIIQDIFIIFLSVVLIFLLTLFYEKTGLSMIQTNLVFLIYILGITTTILFSTLTDHEKYGWVIPSASIFMMWAFYSFAWICSYVSPPKHYVIFVMALMILIGYISIKTNLLDLSGVHSSTLLGLTIMIFGGLKWFFILLSFYIDGCIFTRYKYDYKSSLGIAEERKGKRGYANVFGNGLAGTICAIIYGISHSISTLTGSFFLLMAFIGSIATATGDTMASEIGQTYKGHTVLITNLKPVNPGTNGGISVLGELSALFGSFIICFVALVSNLPINNLSSFAAIVCGSFIGVNIDSVLGATIEDKYLNNGLVNLIATSMGGLFTVLIYLMIG